MIYDECLSLSLSLSLCRNTHYERLRNCSSGTIAHGESLKFGNCCKFFMKIEIIIMHAEINNNREKRRNNVLR